MRRLRRRDLPAGVATVRTSTPYTRLAATVLALGSRGLPVQILQGSLGGLATDGVFGPRTEAAVRGFQERVDVKATGIVDEATWLSLEAQDYPFLRYRSTVLRPGARGPAVAALQRALHVREDGAFGAETEQAVVDFQERRHLARTGVVAALTWEALDEATRTRA